MIIVLLCLVIGVTYAAFDYEFFGSQNVLQTGTVSIEFLESSDIINLSNALPMGDNQGKSQTDIFDFAVTTKANGDITVTYNLYIEKLEVDTGFSALTDEEIKFYLTDESDNQLVAPTKISDLDNAFYSKTNIHSKTNTTIEDSYKIRIWIDKDVYPTGWENDPHQYKFKIGVKTGDVGLNKYGFYYGEPYSTTMSLDGSMVKLQYVFNENNGVVYYYVDGVLAESIVTPEGVISYEYKKIFSDGELVGTVSDDGTQIDFGGVILFLESRESNLDLNEYEFVYDSPYSVLGSDGDELSLRFTEDGRAKVYVNGIRSNGAFFSSEMNVTYANKEVFSDGDLLGTFSDGGRILTSALGTFTFGTVHPIYDEYEDDYYTYMKIRSDGWSVLSKKALNASQGPIESSINGEPVVELLETWNTLGEPSSLENAPIIPKSIKYITEAFSGSRISEINYEGTVAEWQSIQKDPDISGYYVINCSDGTINKDGTVTMK